MIIIRTRKYEHMSGQTEEGKKRAILCLSQQQLKQGTRVLFCIRRHKHIKGYFERREWMSSKMTRETHDEHVSLSIHHAIHIHVVIVWIEFCLEEKRKRRRWGDEFCNRNEDKHQIKRSSSNSQKERQQLDKNDSCHAKFLSWFSCLVRTRDRTQVTQPL